ncbi:glycosyltransferase family 2 protein [Marinibacterium profundimaris]|uniref:Glycosyl transferase family 2 n=1 Tax=Marinibacterium profundimaris TaxID=1679460 RepID=A0A225NUE4_9RHOB|nr:glycosyltransferase family 2 protein [Marinibacterium profundimaris]OWU77880.1 glycosyl transferase family 2 [Marinibacterium profundimaris]
MAEALPRWGLASTIKAPDAEILRFAAWHLEQGAHRLYIYLDDPDSTVYPLLKAHPRIRVRRCTEGWWKKLQGKRPVKHQVRQSLNATHAYARPAEVDWLIHMDADEFLQPDISVADTLAGLPADVLTARVRPEESLAGSAECFKAFIPSGPDRQAIVNRLYPTFGSYLRGGFVSHTAGKLFVRTGLGDLTIRIHNAFRGEDMNPSEAEPGDIALLHCHARDWDDWLAHYRYRLAHGSYRADLPGPRPAEKGGMSLHDLFRWLEADAGEDGLRAFYDEVLSDAAGLPDRLSAERLLRRHDLQLDRLVRKHFPG